MSILLHFIIAYSMFFSSFSGNINDLHGVQDTSFAFKYAILGGYTAFNIPFARFSLTHKDYVFHAFMLTSGKMSKTDAEGNTVGNFYYNGIVLSAGKTIHKDLKNTLYLDVGLYLETADRWYNTGIGLNVKYRRWLYDAFYGEVFVKNLGFSLNPRDLIDFDAIFSLAYQKYGINPFLTLSISPDRGVFYHTGLSVPLHRVFSLNVYYTNAYKEFKFGSGSDLLNGLSIGTDIRLTFMHVKYVADFQGEGGIAHSIELYFLK